MFKLTSNAGIYFKNEDTSFFLDVLYSKSVHPFDKPGKEVLEYIFDTRVDYVMFTHNHPDHFDRSLVLQYLSKYPDAVYIPPLFSKMDTGKTMEVIIKGGTSIHPFVTQHTRMPRNRNCCYLVESKKRSYLFTGDANDNIDDFRVQHKVDYLFINPIFASSDRSREIITEILKPEHIFIYHMPEHNDSYRELLDKAMYLLSDYPLTIMKSELLPYE